MTKEEYIKIMEASVKINIMVEAVEGIIPYACENCSNVLERVREALLSISYDIINIDENRVFSVGQITKKVQ